MNRFLVGLFIIITIAMVVISVIYPEDFALALGTFVIGILLGGIAAYHIFANIHDKGFERSQQLSLKQVVNPATFAREMRLADKETVSKAQPVKSEQKQSKPIPQFNLKGLIND